MPMLPHKLIFVNLPTKAGEGIKNRQNITYVVYGCPLMPSSVSVGNIY